MLLIIATTGVTVLRARTAAEPLADLPIVAQMHREGRASDGALANAQYHAAHARRSHEIRWTLAGYATQGILGSVLGLTLLLARRWQDAHAIPT